MSIHLYIVITMDGGVLTVGWRKNVDGIVEIAENFFKFTHHRNLISFYVLGESL